MGWLIGLAQWAVTLVRGNRLPRFRSWAFELAAIAKLMAFKRDATSAELDRWISDVSCGLDASLGAGHAAEWIDRSARRIADAGTGQARYGSIPMAYHYGEELLAFVQQVEPSQLLFGFRPRDLPRP